MSIVSYDRVKYITVEISIIFYKLEICYAELVPPSYQKHKIIRDLIVFGLDTETPDQNLTT